MNNNKTQTDKSDEIVKLIIQGFERHFFLFQQITLKAKIHFQNADWKALRDSNSERISFYSCRISETLFKILMERPDIELDVGLWRSIKKKYLNYFQSSPQLELAETFYNSVFCNLFEKRYYNNQNIFVKSKKQSSHPKIPPASIYESYYPSLMTLKTTLKNILTSFHFDIPYENIDRDIRFIILSFIKQIRKKKNELHHVRIDVLKSVFYRNKGAYIIGRIISKSMQSPFIIPLLNRKDEKNKAEIYADALLMNPKDMATIFAFYHTNFMVETQSPYLTVEFLHELMPGKSISELYSAIGLHKQGKTEFYRMFLHHLKETNDKFVKAPGIEGMVMAVFTLPSFPYVFKIIKDHFPASKDFSKKTVKKRYQLVKQHDKVGRMADTLEFSNVAIPKARFSKELLTYLQRETQQSIEDEGKIIFFKHIYIQRRVTPLNLILEQSGKSKKIKILNEFAQSIRDMIGANIFPGDLLFKNFGVSDHSRIIFYDYDEIQYMLDVNFRDIPIPQTIEQEFSPSPWYSVGLNDVFPEEFITFLTSDPFIKNYLMSHHHELFEASFWKKIQDNIRQSIFQDIFPYARRYRFPGFIQSSP